MLQFSFQFSFRFLCNWFHFGVVVSFGGYLMSSSVFLCKYIYFSVQKNKMCSTLSCLIYGNFLFSCLLDSGANVSLWSLGLVVTFGGFIILSSTLSSFAIIFLFLYNSKRKNNGQLFFCPRSHMLVLIHFHII